MHPCGCTLNSGHISHPEEMRINQVDILPSAAYMRKVKLKHKLRGWWLLLKDWAIIVFIISDYQVELNKFI